MPLDVFAASTPAITGGVYSMTYTTSSGTTPATIYNVANTTTITSGSNYIVIDNAWGNWILNQSLTNAVTATTTGGQTWSVWCNDQLHAQMREAMRQWHHWNEIKNATDAEARAAIEERRAARGLELERRVAAEARRFGVAAEARRVAELDAANRRAEDLLRRELTEEQSRDLDKKGCFYLETVQPDGSRRKYRIDRGTHGNIKRLDDKGSIIETLCVQPGGVPTADAMLAQKLWLETNEEKLRKTANITRHR